MAAQIARLSGKVALVTGAAAGIGRATVERLVVDGAAVALTDITGYEEVARELQANGSLVVGLEMDVSNGAAVRATVARAADQLGGLHVLVNNAGIGWPRLLEEIGEEEWDRTMAVNLKGPFLCAQAALPYLAAEGGAIVNVASLAGRSSSPAQGCFYSAAKAGLLGLTRHLARELGPRGIRVNAVCPGLIETDFLTRTMSDERIHELTTLIPLQRRGTPADIAAVIAFLASEDAAFVTGAALDANGGIFMA